MFVIVALIHEKKLLTVKAFMVPCHYSDFLRTRFVIRFQN
jgi:hypothetical protein